MDMKYPGESSEQNWTPTLKAEAYFEFLINGHRFSFMMVVCYKNASHFSSLKKKKFHKNVSSLKVLDLGTLRDANGRKMLSVQKIF